MADHAFSNDELRLYELLQQFLCLSDSKQVAGRIIVLGPTGTIVGDASLSAQDIEDATDALLHKNIQRADLDDPPAGPLPFDELPAVAPDVVAATISALQDLADGDLD